MLRVVFRIFNYALRLFVLLCRLYFEYTRAKKHKLTLMALVLKYLVLVMMFVWKGHAAVPPAQAPSTPSSQNRVVLDKKSQGSKIFRIDAQGTDWLSSRDSSSPFFVRYMAPQSGHGVRPSLTLSFDALRRPQSLSEYASKWLADYPRLGLQVLRHQKVRVGAQSAYLVDLMDSKSHKQLRQVLLASNKKIAVLTCRAHKKDFKNILSSCHQIIKNFKWSNASKL